MTFKQSKTKSPNAPSNDGKKNRSPLPSASERLGISISYDEEFDYDPDIEYYGVGDQEKKTTPSSKKKLNEQDSRDYLKFTANNATQNQVRLSAEREKKANPKLFAKFLERAQPKPTRPQWRDRDTTARKEDGTRISTVDWIQMHYGQTLPKKGWSPAGLVMSDIYQDIDLYRAYLSWIKDRPDRDLNLPKQPRNPVTDPAKAIAQNRKVSLEGYHRRK